VRLFALLAALLVLGILFWIGPRALAAVENLPSQGEWEGTIDLRGEARLDFRLDVPPDAAAVFVTLGGELLDLELFANPGTPITDVRDAAYSTDAASEVRTIALDRLGPDPVAGSTWYFTAWWPFVDLPRIGERRLEQARVTLWVETYPARVDGELEPGVALASELDPATGGFRTFQVNVPEGAPALRLDLFDVSSNLDLYARSGGAILRLDPDVAFAENAWGHETLVLDGSSSPPLVPGPWTVDVTDAFGATRRLPFRILASLDARVPAELRSLPTIPAERGTGPLSRALLAVVELATEDGLGSGTLLSSDGWILTNAHVIGEREDVPIVVSLSIDPTLPAEECFRARLVRIDHARDLALVRIESGLYGQPLPPGYVLPTLELGASRALEIGAPLWLVGYPTTGGTGSRVTISATRGIVSGFERADFGTLLKTDAEITQGNSGGAAVDERGLLVGVPSSTVENGSGQIGFVHPIEALPREWRGLIGR